MSHPGNYPPGSGDPQGTPAPHGEEYEVYVPEAPSSAPSAYVANPYPTPGAYDDRPLPPGGDEPWGHPGQHQWGHQVAPEPPRRPRDSRAKTLWWGLGSLGVVAVIISLLVVTGVFDARTDDDPQPQATGEYTLPSDDKKALRVIDKASGISYDYLGSGWQDYSMGTQVEHQESVGEYVVTQEAVPTGGQFIAQVTSGLLSTSFGSPDPSGFPQTLAEVEESVRGNYYPLPNEPTNQSERALKIDGHDAYERVMDLTWDVEGYDSTGERVHLLLIDTGKSAPVFFYCSFPNTHAELYPLIDEVIASIKVDQ